MLGYCALQDPKLGLFKMDFLLLGVEGELTQLMESSEKGNKIYQAKHTTHTVVQPILGLKQTNKQKNKHTKVRDRRKASRVQYMIQEF